MTIELLVHAPDRDATAAEVAGAGGRLLHVLSDHLLVITLPEEVGVDSLTTVAAELPAGLEADEQTVAEAWTSRFGTASRPADRVERAAAAPVLSWDDSGRTPPDGPPDEGAADFMAREAEVVARSTGTPTSETLTGSVAVGVVMASGPGNLAFTGAERLKIMAEVLEGLGFLATADPAAKVTFVYDWQAITVTAAAGAPGSYESLEAPWRNAALQAMGHTGSRQGSVDYVRALRTDRGTKWAYVAYFTKYPVHHFAYAGQERLVMHYDNDNWGHDAINQVFAHETGHIFGAADEYGTCGCGGSGMSSTPNLNCTNCTSTQVPCLMSGNTLQLCFWSRGQIGWSAWQQIAGALKQVSVAADGTVWGVNAADDIFRRSGDKWQRVPGALKQVSAGSASSIWGVNSSDKILRWNGSSWTQVAGALKHVSVAADGTVWGVNAADKIFVRLPDKWQQVAGALKQVSTGGESLVWGVNASNKIYRRW
jgi:hypothetical protein